MSNIPKWYDYEENRYRDDIWPFQKLMKGDRKERAKNRLMNGVKQFVKQLPNGWSVQWRVKRGYAFRIESGKKLIKVPFPRTYGGTAALSVACWTAHKIRDARLMSERDGTVPAYHVYGFGFRVWRVLDLVAYGGSVRSCFHAYDVFNEGMYSFGATMLPYTHHAWRKAAVSGAREVLRYLSTPEAWRLTRQTAKGPMLYRRHLLTRDVLRVVAYRKVLMDYLTVNDARHPLPKRAKALIAKASTPAPAIPPVVTTP